MRFSIGEKVIVSEVPEVKRKLRGRKGEVVGISGNEVCVKIIFEKRPNEEYNFFKGMLRKQDEPFGSNEVERRVKYLKCSGVKCPFCESVNISANPFENDAGTAWADVACSECGNSWRETYELVHYEEPDATKDFRLAEESDRKVVLEVHGGVADVTQCPDGVEVDIIDHDSR